MNIQSEINQAITSASLGDQKTAIAILRGLLKKDPKNVDVWLALAEVVDNPDQAKQCYERVLQIDPDNATARFQLLGEQTLEEFFDFSSDPEPEPTIEPEPPLDFSFDAPSEEIDFSIPAVDSQPFYEEVPVQQSFEPEPSPGEITPQTPVQESSSRTESQTPRKKKKRPPRKESTKEEKGAQYF